jgi:hypothetical protein
MTKVVRGASEQATREIVGEVWQADPRARGKLIEAMESERDYEGWQWVGKLENGMHKDLDFFKDHTHVQMTTVAGQSLTGVQSKLSNLNGIAAATPTERFLLDVRVPDAATLDRLQTWANNAKHVDNVGISVKVLDH